MKCILISITMSLIASPALAWGFGNDNCLQSGYYAPTAVCGNPYMNPLGGITQPTYGTTLNFPEMGYSTTMYTGGFNGYANTLSFPELNMSTTTYQGF
jgi:hypothetical protein